MGFQLIINCVSEARRDSVKSNFTKKAYQWEFTGKSIYFAYLYWNRNADASQKHQNPIAKKQFRKRKDKGLNVIENQWYTGTYRTGLSVLVSCKQLGCNDWLNSFLYPIDTLPSRGNIPSSNISQLACMCTARHSPWAHCLHEWQFPNAQVPALCNVETTLCPLHLSNTPIKISLSEILYNTRVY